jgi:preprotein translocase subunit YajC
VGGYIFILVLLVMFWFLLIRPQRRRQLESQRLLDSLAVGKEIVTAGGLYGTITALDEDEARVEIADGVEVRVAKRAIAGVLSHDEEDDEAEELEEGNHG